ncbi:unnamed protein product [Diamesa tonsa]
MMKSSGVAYLESLPEEIIEKILSNVEDKKNCYLVNKRINELCLNLDQDKFCVNFKYLCVFNKLDNEKLMNSMIKSNRIIKKMRIEHSNCSVYYQKLKQLFRKLGSHLEELEMDYIKITPIQLSKLLNLLPNLKYLRLDPRGEDNTISKRKWFRMLFLYRKPKCLMLHNLKSLTLNSCNHANERVFRSLPEGVVENFTRTMCEGRNVEKFMKKQKNIKNLSVCYRNETESIEFEHLELTVFKCHLTDCTTLLNVINTQPKLTKLSLERVKINDAIFNQITYLHDLKSIKISIKGVTSDKFINIGRLHSLQELGVIDASSSFIHALSQCKFLNLTKINLRFEDVDDEVDSIDLIDISQNNSELIYVKIDKLYVPQSVVKAFLTNCRNMEVLEFTKYLGYEEIVCDSLNGILDDTQLFNHNLKTIVLPNLSFNFNFQDNFISNFPNLIRLRLMMENKYNWERFQLLLNGLPKLKIIELQSFSEMTPHEKETVNMQNKDRNMDFCQVFHKRSSRVF